MKTTSPLACAGLLAALALAGCGHSPPSRFFTLDPVAPAPGPPPAAAMAPVQLDAVHIPPALDRPELVTQIGPNRLSVSDQDRWGAPLGEMMRRTLAQDLAARLPPGAFAFPDAPRPAGVRALVVTILQLTAGPDGRVEMQANWSLLPAGSSRAQAGMNVTLSAAGGAGSGGQAQALSTVLGELADRIASGLPRG